LWPANWAASGSKKKAAKRRLKGDMKTSRNLIMSIHDLQAEIQQMPDSWAFVPVVGKRPLSHNWVQNPLSRAECSKTVARNPRYTGVGVHCGTSSGGILFVDVDGAGAQDLLTAWAGGAEIPVTAQVTSGRSGRGQLLFQVPEELWPRFRTRKFKSAVPGELLELRWDGAQSVVAGAHPETGGYRWVAAPWDVAIAQCPEFIIRKMLSEDAPVNSAAALKAGGFAKTGDNAGRRGSAHPHIEQLLRVKSRDLLSGVGEGERNDTAALLALELIGIERYCREVGQPLEGSAEHSFQGFCSACSPPIAASEVEAVWRSAERSTDGPSVPTDSIQRIVAAHYNRIERSAQKGARPQQRSSAARATDNGLGVLPDQAGVGEAFEEALKRRKADGKSIGRIFPDWFEDLLEEAAAVLPTNPDAIRMPLLSAIASLIGLKARFSPRGGWSEPSICSTAFSAPTGRLKSPTLKLVTGPLFEIQSELQEKFDAEIKAFRQREAAAAKAKVEFDEEAPVAHRVVASALTVEALVVLHANNLRGQGPLTVQDELSQFFQSMGQYKGGRGSDREHWLQLLSGEGCPKDYADGRRVWLPKSSVSVTGSIQPEVLSEILQKQSDHANGLISRFSIAELDMPLPLLSEDDSEKEWRRSEEILSRFRAAVTDLFRKLLALDDLGDGVGEIRPKIYAFDEAARSLHRPWHNEQARQGGAVEIHPAVRAVINKQRGFAVRFAGILHIASYCLDKSDWHPGELVSPGTVIGRGAVARGIHLADFFIGQMARIFGQNLDYEDSEIKDAQLADLAIKISGKVEDGWVSPSALRQNCRKFGSTDEARKTITKWGESGHGEIRTNAAGRVTHWRWVESGGEISSDANDSPASVGLKQDSEPETVIAGESEHPELGGVVSGEVVQPQILEAVVAGEAEPAAKLGDEIEPLEGVEFNQHGMKPGHRYFIAEIINHEDGIFYLTKSDKGGESATWANDCRIRKSDPVAETE
jgi:hypothetical protein